MKKFLIVVCVIVVVCLLGYAGEYMNEDAVPTNTVSSNNKQNVSSTSGTKVNNTTKKEENTKVEKEEKVEENKVEEEKVEEEKKDETEDKKEPVVEENSVSSEDKAIDLAKKKYGTSNGVYFRIEQIQSNGVYIVSVRDSETTKDLAWYTVDVNNGTVK